MNQSNLKSLIISLLLSLGACKRTISASQTHGITAEALEQDKKLHDLSPEYLSLGSLDKDGVRRIRLGIFINCDPFPPTDGASAPGDLCTQDIDTHSSNYGDQVFRQMITWLAGYTFNNHLKLEAIDSATPFIEVDKITAMRSTSTSRKISFTGQGPAVDHRKEGSARYSEWEVTINLTAKNTDLLKTVAASVRDFDMIYVAGSIYNQTDLAGDRITDDKTLAPYLSALIEPQASDKELSAYKMVILNSCFTEALEDSLFSAWDSVLNKSSKNSKLDIVGQRGKSNYRHFTQQLARILSHLHEGSNWVDILKGLKIKTTDKMDEDSVLNAAFQHHNFARSTISILRNNQELSDRKLDRSLLFDETHSHGE